LKLYYVHEKAHLHVWPHDGGPDAGFVGEQRVVSGGDASALGHELVYAAELGDA
jgi:hypothetical protein